jgi:hypothetical protein
VRLLNSIRRLAGWPHPRQVFDSALIVLLLAVYAWRFLLPLLTEAQAPRADDFQDYMYAARQISIGGDPYADFARTHLPWDWSLSSGYLYPPAFAAFLIPLTFLSNDLAVRLWLLLIQAAVVASLLIVYAMIGRPSRRELLCVVGITTTFLPLAASVWTGAMNSILLLMLTVAWALWLRGRDGISGVVVGLAAVFKVFPLALLPYLAWRRHWRLVIAAGVTGLAGLGFGVLVTGIDHNLFYFRELLPHLSAGTGFRENQSLAGLASRICAPSTLEQGGSAGWCGRALGWPAALTAVGLLIVAVRRPERRPLEFALAVTILPLISSVTWSFHLVLLLFPIALLIRHFFDQGTISRGQLTVLVLAWLCFTLGPAAHYALIIYAVSPGPWILQSGARLLNESYLIGTLILFGNLWFIVRSRPQEESDASRRLAA